MPREPTATPTQPPAPPPPPLYEVVEEGYVAHPEGGESLVIKVRLAGSAEEHTCSWTPDCCPSLEAAHEQIQAWAEAMARG